MKMIKVYIWFVALFFIVYGVAFVISPVRLTAWATSGELLTPSNVTDVRATYGGMTIAVGLVLTATFAFCIMTFLCKVGRKCCDHCDRCGCCSNEKSPKDHNLTTEEEATRELVNTIMKSDSAEMAYIEKCGYSSVNI